MLEINQEHKKCNVNNLDKEKLQKFVASGLIALNLLSGSLNVYAKDLNNPEIIVNENIKQQLDVYLDYEKTYNANDLSNLLYMSLMIEEDTDLSWLKYATNLEEIMLSYGEKVNSMDTISTISGLNKLKKASIYSYKEFDEVNKVSYSFLKDAKNLKELDLNGVYVDDDFIESLTSLEVLRIGDNIINFDIDFSKLPNLKEVEFYNLNEYDVATYLDDYTIRLLEDRGVSITTSYVDLDKVVEINKELNKIVYSLGVTSMNSDKEKLNAILTYILDNLSYDETTYQNIQNSMKDDNLVNSFYTNGFLDGALNGDSAICGNYASLFQALANRVGMKSYFMVNDNHAWNLVNIDGEYYYVDPTYLEGVSIDVDNDGKLDVASDIIKSGNYDKLEWYMKDVSKANDSFHQPINMPLHIEIKPIENNNDKNNYSFACLYKINLNGIEYIIPIGVVIGLFSILGLARKNKNKQNSKKRYK